jgi:hypothetical protein
MKTLLPIGAVSLLIGMAAFTGMAQTGVHDRFVGAWRLVSLEQQDAYGKVHRIDCCGLFVFTSDGHMSVQVMQRDPQPEAPSGPPQ